MVENGMIISESMVMKWVCTEEQFDRASDALNVALNKEIDEAMNRITEDCESILAPIIGMSSIKNNGKLMQEIQRGIYTFCKQLRDILNIHINVKMSTEHEIVKRGIVIWMPYFTEEGRRIVERLLTDFFTNISCTATFETDVTTWKQFILVKPICEYVREVNFKPYGGNNDEQK